MFASDSPEHADGERRGAKTGSVELVPTTGHAFAYFSDRAHRQASASPDVLKQKEKEKKALGPSILWRSRLRIATRGGSAMVRHPGNVHGHVCRHA